MLGRRCSHDLSWQLYLCFFPFLFHPHFYLKWLLENTNISGCLACRISQRKKKKQPVFLTDVSEVLPFVCIVCLSDAQLQGSQHFVSNKSLMSTFTRSYCCFFQTAMSRGNIPWLSTVPYDESPKYFLPDGSAHLIWKATVSVCWCWCLQRCS